MKLLIALICISSYSFAGIYEPATLWNKKEINVCFVDHIEQVRRTNYQSLNLILSKISLLKRKKARKWNAFIQKRVNDNFQRYKTGINFRGWKSCSSSPDADAYIILSRVKKFLGSGKDPSQHGFASIGEDGVFGAGTSYLRKGGFKPFVYLNISKQSATPDEASLFSTVAVHEFGHLAGLRHEHSREEGFLRDQRCIDYWSKRFLKNDRTGGLVYSDLRVRGYVETEGWTSMSVTAYDPDSIMNYCSFFGENMGKINNLTHKDMRTLRIMYPN